MLAFTFPDDSVREFPDGVTLAGVAETLGPRFQRALGGVVGDTLYDMQTGLHASGPLKFVFEKDEEALALLRHTCAHIMAQAVREVFGGTPGGKPYFAIGPVIDDGFYYDIDIDKPFTPEDLEKIEARMAEIIRGKFPIQRRVVPREDVLEFFKGDTYKEELIRDLPKDAELSTYTQDTFTDLCRGPHAPDTGCVKAFKLLKVAGAYWRGDVTRPMLQRIYGTAWRTRADLDAYLARLEEARKRDHRALATQLDLFHIAEEAPGSVFWHPKGWTIWRVLEDYIRRHLADAGYKEVRGPQILDRSLWERSGHWEKFRELMFTTETENRQYAVKPMNCPGHILIFNATHHSYRDLPLRLAEFGSCHRNEPSGTLHGIFRVRAFVQDDAHIFCTEDQIGSEVESFVRLLQKIYADFGFHDVIVKIATRPEKRIGADEVWDKAEKALEDAMHRIGLEFKINPGEGAFYGPKIEFSVPDAIGRVWQLGTIQVDFSMPERLGATYVGEDNAKHVPVMLHRAILGSLERFIGILIEHYAGAFPLWLAPIQVRVLTVTDKSIPYAEGIAEGLRGHGYRVEIDTGSEKIGKKIREAEMMKIPYMLVLGERDAEASTVSVRRHKEGDLGAMSIEEFLKKMQADSRVDEL
ncbi:MAG: threonine--tRNA ligase [Candidatus Hydrogenedentota bacterium]